MSAIFKKMKNTFLVRKLISVANKVFDNVKTDLDNDTILGYIKDVAMMGTTDVCQLQIPMNGYYRDGHQAEFPNSDGWSLVPTNGVSSAYDTSANAAVTAVGSSITERENLSTNHLPQAGKCN